jgi:CRISPR-associated protein Csd2
MTIEKRHDFLFVFDVKDGNPNGDPDFDNTPRFDPETFQGLVSDVALKRKIRNYVQIASNGNGPDPQSRNNIFVQQGYTLESFQKLPFENEDSLKGEAKDGKTSKPSVETARKWMCDHFYDVRAFGAVMNTTKFRCGQVLGPVQITFARSVDRIFSTDHGITRVAYTQEKKAAGTTGTTEMGNKKTVAYGLYVAHGFINPHQAKQTGFNDDDLKMLWQALGNMFELDRSAARGLMSARNLFVFEHSSSLGNAPAHKLFEKVKISRKEGIESPRDYSDYTIELSDKLPEGVTVQDILA